MAKLDIFYHGSDRKVAVVYGRKGIGKTTLLKEFANGKNMLWFTAYPTTDQMELHLMADAFRLDIVEPRLEDILDEVTKMAEGATFDHPLLLFIENYPDFAKASGDNGKILHKYVKDIWKKLPIKLVFSGESYMNLEKTLLGKKTVWSDINKMIMEMKPLSFLEARLFMDGLSPEEQVGTYGITGGIPALLDLAERKKPKEAMETIFFCGMRTPYHPEVLMSSELRELSYYNRMLTTLASGNQRVNEIAEEVGKPKDVVVPYMNTLISIGLVKKETPVTEKTNRRKTRYSVVNTSDEFWYRYLTLNFKDVVEDNADELWENVVLPDLDHYLKGVFCRIAQEYIMEEASSKLLPFRIDEIGNWWENDEQNHTTTGFDLVGLGTYSGEETTVFCRVYYGDTPVEIHELKALIELTRKMKTNGSSFYIVFSKAGFHENAITVASAIKNIVLITLDDIIAGLDECSY